MSEKLLRTESRHRLYRWSGLNMAIIFGIVGLLFLFIPGNVVNFFNKISPGLGFEKSPADGTGFYLVLAVGYMYLVTLLACLMFKYPDHAFFPVLLIHGKTVSSVLSFVMFIKQGPFLIYLANGIVDGLIALYVFILFRNTRKKNG